MSAGGRRTRSFLVTEDRSELAITCAIALAWGLVVAVGAYAIVRAVQSVTVAAADPAALTWSIHTGFFWRVWTVVYLGGFAAFVAFIVARGRPQAAARALAPAIAVAASLLALQSAFLP
jgi:H+/Cl- antiporter ClcA